MVVNIPVLTALAIGRSRCFDADTRGELKKVTNERLMAWCMRTRWWRRWWWAFWIIFALPLIGLPVVLIVDLVADDFFAVRGYPSIPTVAWIIEAVFMIPALCLGFWHLNQQRENLIRALPREYLIGFAGGRKPAIVLFDRASEGGVGGEKRRFSLGYVELLFPFTLTRMMGLRAGTFWTWLIGFCVVLPGGLYLSSLLGESAQVVVSMALSGVGFLVFFGILSLTVRWVLRCRTRLMEYAESGACPSCEYAMGAVSINEEVRRCSECGIELPFVLDGVGVGK